MRAVSTVPPKSQEKTVESPFRLGSLSWLVGKQVSRAKGGIETPEVDTSDSSHLREEPKKAEQPEESSTPVSPGEQVKVV